MAADASQARKWKANAKGGCECDAPFSSRANLSTFSSTSMMGMYVCSPSPWHRHRQTGPHERRPRTRADRPDEPMPPRHVTSHVTHPVAGVPRDIAKMGIDIPTSEERDLSRGLCWGEFPCWSERETHVFYCWSGVCYNLVRQMLTGRRTAGASDFDCTSGPGRLPQIRRAG